jgi:Tol biopolymer transport system component
MKLPALDRIAPDTSALPAETVSRKLAQVTFDEAIEEYAAWMPGGTEILFSRDRGGSRKIFRKNIVTREESQLTNGDYDEIQPSCSPDGRTVVFVRARQAHVKLEPGDVFGMFVDGDIWALDLASGKEAKLIANGFNPDYSPDGRRIAFDASWVGPRRIWVVDNQGHNPQQLTSDTSEAVTHVRPRWSPDGARIVFQNIERTKFDVRVIDLGTGQTTWITNDAVQDIDPVWSPSGQYIYFSSYRGGGINIWRVRVATDGTPARLPYQLTIGAGQDVELAVSRDGKSLAFTTLRQNADIWRLPVSPQTGKPTGAPQEVITTTREDSRGAWSPDGKMIAFNSDRTGEMNIWLYSIADRSSRQLTEGPGGDYQANWSPDGKRIVFFSSRAGTADIWQVELATGEVKPLRTTTSIDVNPFYSPDGRLIAYNSDESGRPEVWIMNGDGTEARQLTNVGVMGHFLRWNRNGDGVIFRCPGHGQAQTLEAPIDGREPRVFGDIVGGSHMSLSPDFSRVMDVVGHKTLWVSSVQSNTSEKVFEFDDPDVRIDYPVWSPDGQWVLFDRFRPQGGDIWMMENIE